MHPDTDIPSKGLRRSDVHVAAALFVAGLMVAWLGYQMVSPEILHPITYDYWFESDIPDVKEAMLDRLANQHWRAQHHPLFPYLTTPPTMLLNRVMGLSAAAAVGLVTAMVAGLFVAGIYWFLRMAALESGYALAFTGVAALSAASVFWLPVPEAYALGAISIIPALVLVARPPAPGPRGMAACVVAAALTLAGSTNNWGVGLLMLAAVLPWRRAMLAAVLSVCVTWLGWRIGVVLVPNAPSFIELGEAETAYLFNPLGLGPIARLAAVFSHTMVLPELREVLGSYLSPQGVRPGSGGALTAAGTLAWAALLVLGAAATVRGPARRLSIVAALSLGGQAVFYQAFGIETFHYSVQLVPLFVAFVAPAALGAWRRPALAAALLFVALAGTNNVLRFRESAHALQGRYARERAFTARIAELTSADRPVVYGARAAAAESYVEPPPAPRGKATPIWYLGLFPELKANRTGWHVFFDHWSVDLVESYRAAGAAYFVSSYRYGLDRSDAFLAELDARYERLERTPDWVIYALRPPR